MRIPIELARGILACADSGMPLDYDSIEKLRGHVKAGEAERNRIIQARAAKARARRAERLAAAIMEI